MIRNEELTEGFSSYEIVEIIKGMSDNAKEKILRNEDFLEKKKYSWIRIEKYYFQHRRECKERHSYGQRPSYK